LIEITDYRIMLPSNR